MRVRRVVAPNEEIRRRVSIICGGGHLRCSSPRYPVSPLCVQDANVVLLISEVDVDHFFYTGFEVCVILLHGSVTVSRAVNPELFSGIPTDTSSRKLAFSSHLSTSTFPYHYNDR